MKRAERCCGSALGPVRRAIFCLRRPENRALRQPRSMVPVTPLCGMTLEAHQQTSVDPHYAFMDDELKPALLGSLKTNLISLSVLSRDLVSPKL